MPETAPALADVLRDELLCIADSKWVLGHWYVKVIPNGRSLTDFNALAAMAQGQLGHTRALFGLLEQRGQSSERLEFGRLGTEVHSMAVLDAPPANWADFIVAASLAEYALRTLFGAYRDGTDAVLAQLAQQCENECEFHTLYLDGGLQGLSDTEREQACASLASRYPIALRWFDTSDDADAALVRWRPEPLSSLRTAFVDVCQEGIAERIGAALPARAAANGAWDPVRRRPRGTAMPPRLWEFVVPTNEQAVMCRRPLIESTKDGIRFSTAT